MEPVRMESFRIDFLTQQNGIFQKIFLAKPESFRIKSFGIESFRKKYQNGIFRKIFSAKPESFGMEFFRKNISERSLTEGIFQKRSELA
jgi:hypothetical protein